jgi:hypothetical protein
LDAGPGVTVLVYTEAVAEPGHLIFSTDGKWMVLPP